MQFKVPQFLDIEDKIFGPFTFKQFVYIAGGAGLCFFFFQALGLLWGAIPILIVGGFAGALAFYRPNNKPFINMVEASFKYAIGDKLYIWKREVKKVANKEHGEIKTTYSPVTGPKLGASKLRDLAWSLDVLDLNKNKEN